MIRKEDIVNFLTSELEDKDVFLVDVNVKPGNIIKVYVDKEEGINILECSDISRKITSHFDRDVEDYALDVSSPGLDMPLQVKEQYKKNIGKEVQVILSDGSKKKGVLASYDESFIELDITKKTADNKKGKDSEPERIKIYTNDIKTVKVVISFK